MASVAPLPGPSTAANVRFIAPPRAGRAKLRVGVFADRAAQPRWLVEAIAKAAASESAEVVLVAVGNWGQTPIIKERNWGRSPLWRAYCGLDRRLFGNGIDWSERRDVTQIVPRAHRLALDGKRGDALAGVAGYRLDVAFAIGEVDDDALAHLARFGTWRYCFGDEQGTEETLAGAREVFDGRLVVASGLRIRHPGLGDRIACASYSRAFGFSLARSRGCLLPKSAELLQRALRDLQSNGPAWLESGTQPARAFADSPHAASGTLLAGLTRVGARVARRAAEKYLTIGQWQLAYRLRGDAAWDGSLEGFTRLVPPRDRFWADPFPVEANGRHYIFFEELPFGAGRAHISVIEIDPLGRASQPVRVLERDYHLSYPFLVEDEGRLYMIPETAQNRTIEIYRCVEFPHKWKLERTLMRDLWAVDATLHRAADRWWMFANVGFDGSEVNDELHLFSAERLLGEWRAHRRNPAKSDVRGARPAGRLFSANGELYRPGQVCTPIYGAGIVLHRVLRLDDGDYVEEKVRSIAPRVGDGVLGIHTWNRAGALAVTDAFVRRPRF